MIQMQKSVIRGYLHHLHYIPGHFKNGDESVHFEVLPVEPVHDIPTLHGLIEADSLLFSDDRRYYSGDEYFLTDQQAEKLRFFIRSERDRIKYNGKRKTYEEWVMLGIPLEDYLPYGGEVSCEWLNKLTWLNCEDPYHKQWVAEYKSPVDRPAPIVPVYHTFYNFNGELVYMGICAKG